MKKLFLLFSLVGVLSALGQVERVTVDSATRDVTNTGVVNFMPGLLKVNGVNVIGGAGGGGGGAVDSVNGQTGTVVIHIAPAILVHHVDGSSTPYQPATNTDTDRGTALLSATATLVTGDIMDIGAGTFAIGSSHMVCPDGAIIVRGAGHGITTITSTVTTGGAAVKPGTGNTLQGFTVNSSTNPVGWLTPTYGQTAAVTCILIDIEAISDQDCFHFVGNTSFTLTMVDCIGLSYWDVFTQLGNGTNTMTVKNCTFTAQSPTQAYCRPVYLKNTGSETFEMFGGEIIGNFTNSAGGVAAANVSVEIGGGGVYLYGVTSRATGAGQYDLSDVALGANIFISGGSGSGTGGSFTIASGSTVNYTGAVLKNTPGVFTTLNTTDTNNLSLTTGTGAVATAMTLTDPTAASNGLQIPSPGFTQTGRGYKTDASAGSRTVAFRSYVQPVQGTSAPTGIWKLERAIGGGSPTNVLQVFSDGNIQPTTGYLASDGTAGLTTTFVGSGYKDGLLTTAPVEGTDYIRITGDPLFGTVPIADGSGAAWGYVNGSVAKVYRALLTQDGTTAPPSAIVIENTIGNIVWTRITGGVYAGTLTAAFTGGKTFLLHGDLVIVHEGAFTSFVRSDANTLNLTTSDFDAGGPSVLPADGMLSNTEVQILVYP